MLGDICRVCLANNINGFDIFNNYKGDYNLREIIYELSLVEVSTNVVDEDRVHTSEGGSIR